MGAGDPVLMLHGSGPGVSAWVNCRFPLGKMSANFCLIVPDMAGFGYTEIPKGATFQQSLWLDQLIALLDTLGVERVHIIGNSFGGAIALALAVHHPDRVGRVVLMGSAGVPMKLTPGLDAAWGYQPSIDNMRKILTLFAHDESLVKYNNSGGYAEFVLASDRGMVKLPNTLTMSDGAMIEPLAVALHGVLQTPIKAGSRVLVLGAGPIGLSAVFWAKRMGATKVAVCELSRLREDIARTMGADEFIVGSEHDRPLSDVVAEKMGRLPDVVLECVGFPGMLGQAIECIHPVGTIGIVGFCVVKDGFVPADVIAKEARMIFSSLYNLQEYEHVARTLDAGAVEPRHMLSRTICLRDLPAAFETLRKTGPDVKVHVDPWL